MFKKFTAQPHFSNRQIFKLKYCLLALRTPIYRSVGSEPIKKKKASTGNLGLLPLGILPLADPLRTLESLLAAFINSIFTYI